MIGLKMGCLEVPKSVQFNWYEWNQNQTLPPAKLARIQPPKTTSPQVTTRPSARSAPKARCEASNWRTWRCWVIPRHLAGSWNLEHQDYPTVGTQIETVQAMIYDTTHWIHSAKIIYYPATNTVCSNRKMGPSNEGDMVFWWSWPSCVGLRFRGSRVHFDLLLPVSCCKSNPNHHQISSQDFHNIYNSNGRFLFPNSRIYRWFFFSTMLINLNRSTSITFPAWYNSWRMAPKCPPEKNPPQQWTDPSALSAAKASGARVGWVESSKVKCRGHAWILRNPSSFSRKMYIKGCRRPGTEDCHQTKFKKKSAVKSLKYEGVQTHSTLVDTRWYPIFFIKPTGVFSQLKGCLPTSAHPAHLSAPSVPSVPPEDLQRESHHPGMQRPSWWSNVAKILTLSWLKRHNPRKQCFKLNKLIGCCSEASSNPHSWGVRRLNAIPIAGECSISITMYII